MHRRLTTRPPNSIPGACHTSVTRLQCPAVVDVAQQARKTPAIVGMFGAAPPIPPCEVQSVVVSAVLVVHVVVQRRGEPPPPPRRKPGSWFELDTAMARGVAH